jgi:hypothetical protein
MNDELEETFQDVPLLSKKNYLAVSSRMRKSSSEQNNCRAQKLEKTKTINIVRRVPA